MKQDDNHATSYLLEVLDPLMPRYAIRKRVKDYVAYVVSADWQDQTGQEESPIILIACLTVADLIYAKRRAKKEFEDYDLGEDGSTRIRFAKIEQVTQLGVTARIWEEIQY